MQRNNLSSLKSIVYVNYSPYENSGKILDYFRENFIWVFAFSFGFHHLKNKKNYNSITIYKNGAVWKKYFFFSLPMSPQLTFLLLPLRSLLTFFQIILFCMLIKLKFGTADIYFSVNAFTAWIGNALRAMGIVKKTVFWVWDYYPPKNESSIIFLMRFMYWQFDKLATISNRVAFVNRRLINLRKDMGLLPADREYPIISIGTDPIRTLQTKKKSVVFGFLGVVKKSQGPGVVFDHAAEILQKYPRARYEIVGSGPDENFYRQKAHQSNFPTEFHGYVAGDNIREIFSRVTIGIATYIPDEQNVSHYGDAGKIKLYLSLGIPVIATNVYQFSEELKRRKAGVVIDISRKQEFLHAVDVIMRDYSQYSRNALSLSKKYYYKKLYPAFFSKK